MISLVEIDPVNAIDPRRKIPIYVTFLCISVLAELFQNAEWIAGKAVMASS